MPRIDGVNVTQYDNLNIDGLCYVNGFFLNFERSGNFTNSNITNVPEDIHLRGRLFINGSEKTPTTTGSIVEFSDAGGGNTTVTANAQNFLTNGLQITISGTTNYNGTFTISNTTSVTFDIPVAFAGDDATGTWTMEAIDDTSFAGTRLTNVNILGEIGLNNTLYVFPQDK